MKNNLTEMVFILDRSGSMCGLEGDTIGGFNSMIDNQKKQEGEALVTTVLFDNEYELLHDRVKLSEINKMTDKEYYVCGCTALLDAVGKTISHISMIRKYIREEDIPQNTIIAITTDGMENASHEYNYEQIKKMIEEKKKDGWEFLFIGANIDAAEEASRIGISRDRAANYISDSVGTGAVYNALSESMSCMRKTGAVAKNWNENIMKDAKRRKK